MILFPAIDILDGRAVRLLYGDRNKVTDYGCPVALAKKWKELGAEYLHMVDLNAAFDGNSVNDEVIKSVRAAADIPIQMGGGFRSMERVAYCLDTLGVDRAIVGSTAVLDFPLFAKICERYKEKIACGIDARNGKVAVKGWTEECEVAPLELALRAKGVGVDTVIFTDITRDGALTGVNAEATVELQINSGMNIIASGGMASLEDVRLLLGKNVYGAILGKSIYNGNIDLKEALLICGR